MSTRSELTFSDDRSLAVDAVESIAAGKGWCNVSALTVDDAPNIQVNVFGLWVNKGVAKVTYVTEPDRQGVPQPSTLGVLHTRGRLGRELINSLIGDAPFAVRQDHNQRGLLLEVPAGTSAIRVVDVMCSLSATLCDYDKTGTWRLELFTRK